MRELEERGGNPSPLLVAQGTEHRPPKSSVARSNRAEETPRRECKKWTYKERVAATNLYQSGWSARKIKAFTGVPTGTLYEWLRRDGIPRRPRSAPGVIEKLPHSYYKLITHLYVDEKLSTNEIGEIIGRSGSRVSRHLKQAGVPLRNRSEYTALAYARGRTIPPVYRENYYREIVKKNGDIRIVSGRMRNRPAKAVQA